MEPSTEEISEAMLPRDILRPKNSLPTPEYNSVRINEVKFKDRSVSQDEIDTYSQINPDIPVWLVGAILHFNKKHPHYIKTGCYGKDPPTEEQIAEAAKTVGGGKSKKLLGANYVDTRFEGEQEWSQEKCKMTIQKNAEQYEKKCKQVV